MVSRNNQVNSGVGLARILTNIKYICSSFSYFPRQHLVHNITSGDTIKCAGYDSPSYGKCHQQDNHSFSHPLYIKYLHTRPLTRSSAFPSKESASLPADAPSMQSSNPMKE